MGQNVALFFYLDLILDKLNKWRPRYPRDDIRKEPLQSNFSHVQRFYFLNNWNHHRIPIQPARKSVKGK